MRTSPKALEKGSKQKMIVQIGPYYINARPRAKGGYSYVYQGWHESDERIQLAFKLLLLHDRRGFLSRSQTRDIDNMVSLVDAMSRRPGATSNHPDLYVDFPFLPLLDIIDVSSSTKSNVHRLKEYESEANAELSLLLVFPFCELDLKTYLKHGSLYSAKEEDVLRVAYQILRAVGIMHSLGWSHRDLKPENMLISRDGQLLLCDFGMARCEVTFLRRFGVSYNYDYRGNSYTDTKMPIREYDERCAVAYDPLEGLDRTQQPGIVSRRLLPPAGATSICGTIWWRAPEQSFRKNVNCSGFIGDSWSLGCILIQLLFDYPAFHSKDRDENTGSGEVLAYVNQLRPLAENEDFLEAIVSFNGVSRSFIDSFRAVTTKLNKARAADLQRILAMPREQVEAVLANARDSNAGREDSNLQEPPVKHSDDPLKQIPSHIKQLIILNRHAILSPYRDCDAIYSTSRYTLKQACFLMLVLRFAPLPKVVEMMDKPAISVQELTILLELSPTAICFYNMYSDLVSKLMNPNPLRRLMPTEALTHPIFDNVQNSFFFKLNTSNSTFTKPDETNSANNFLQKISAILNRKVDFNKDYLPVLLNEISHRTLDELVFTYCPNSLDDV
ncbi:Kinase, CMGC CMGC-GL1 [Giardia duodenalis]|uniref:Kinase, CMGC CMGC-GL1 n=1 Tax=Giardia intestinalis (strain ATCC 50803 / WB clone C6) TaxID=184922 RepID=A8B4B8_GIAIC|nr:Kinase, CMGC CMGC-GL1 [Giardia intestinalis]KAE8303651.1 Kinase, CMGC CMGC-GL1 [Giardia intestinalis]|eukprot:XP_001709549.1 Kinase, CMGC CMGC-GL1 [Giardia lamblia ATCC 50803]